ncbi:hypothetical protein A7Q09_05335 [Methylacidiphilum sp. Yel]|nr:hypothetical protein A7Q09_05335 [Methylacidiphilum sp. Yel]
MHAEREQRRVGLRVTQRAARQKRPLDSFRAPVLRKRGRCGQLPGETVLAPDGPRPCPPPFVAHFFDAEGALDPAGQGIPSEGVDALGDRPVLHPTPELLAEGRVGCVPRIGHAPERLHDDRPATHLRTEQQSGDLSDAGALLAQVLDPRKGGRGAHALEFPCLAGLPDPTNQHRHVGSLAAAVGVKLVQYQEAETPSCFNQAPLDGPGEDELEHDVVSEQDVRGILDDLLPFGVRFLTGVAAETDGASPVGEPQLQKLAELASLAVGEGVHGVDDDGPDALPGPLAQHGVHNGNEVSKTLP